MSVGANIPEAWPALLSKQQLRAYLGDLGDETIRHICPVPPLDLGVSVLRYRKADVDAWLNRLPARQLRAAEEGGQHAPEPKAANEGASSAAARARARAGK